MKFEIKKRENYISMFFSMKIPFVTKTIRQHFMLYNTPEAWVHGYSSRTQFGRYVLFQDYDNLDLEAVEQELKYLQQKYKLSDYYIFETDRENSFHAVCLDTFPIIKTFNILKDTSSDQAFIHSIKKLQSREWILRWGKKGERSAPQYLKTIPSKNRQHKRSSAHGAFLKKLGVKVNMYNSKDWDGGKVLALIDYDTANRTKA